MKLKLDIKNSYLAMIRNSVGTKMFRNLYFSSGKRSADILQDGNLSCAVYVSSVLYLLGLIKTPHATVASAINDMQKSGWVHMKKPKVGAVVVWQAKKSGQEVTKHHLHTS